MFKLRFSHMFILVSLYYRQLLPWRGCRGERLSVSCRIKGLMGQEGGEEREFSCVAKSLCWILQIYASSEEEWMNGLIGKDQEVAMRSPSNATYLWLACFQESWLGFAFSLGSGRMRHVPWVHSSTTWLVMEGNTYWTAVMEQAHTNQHQKLRTISSTWSLCGRNSLSTDHCPPGFFSRNEK